MHVGLMTFGNEDPKLFREAFERACSHLPCGVAVLTGIDPEEGPFGLTVSSLAFLSAKPPLVSACIDRHSRKAARFGRNRHLAVNLLRHDQKPVATFFSTPGAAWSKALRWYALDGGAPILEDSLGVLLCERQKEFDAGDHKIVIGEVHRLSLRGGEPLVYWRRAFHRLWLEYPFLQSEATLDDFVRRWEAGRLTKPEWTHGAHVGTAAYHAYELDAEALFERMKTRIIYHNECVGTANTEDHGYHETLTRFWAWTVGEFVRRGRFSTRFEAVKNATQLFGEDRDRHRLFYGFDVLRDRRARREWIKPDRQPPCQTWHLGHDDFVLEAAGGDDQKNRTDEEEGQTVSPEMSDARAPEDDAAGNVDVIARGNEIADDVEESGHGLAGENVAGKEDAGKKSQEGKLDGLGLGVGFAGDENANGKRNEKIGK
jgi:flavin reductase ActVB